MISEYLTGTGATGEQNAIAQADLCRRLGLLPTTLKRIVQTERRDGALICSSAAGYYMPQDTADIAKFYKETRAAALSRLTSCRAFRQALTDAGWKE